MMSAKPIGRAILAVAVTPVMWAYGADVLLGDPVLRSGLVYVDVSVRSEANESLAGLQFDVSFDGDAYRVSEVELGAVADAAGKDAIYTGGAEGYTRLLVTGMNQDAMADGVVATLVLEPIAGMVNSAIQIERPIFSDPFGNALVVGQVKQTALSMAAENESDESAVAELGGEGEATANLTEGTVANDLDNGEHTTATNDDGGTSSRSQGGFGFGGGFDGGDDVIDDGTRADRETRGGGIARGGTVEGRSISGRRVYRGGREAVTGQNGRGSVASADSESSGTGASIGSEIDTGRMQIARAVDTPLRPTVNAAPDETPFVVRQGSGRVDARVNVRDDAAASESLEGVGDKGRHKTRWPGIVAGSLVFGCLLFARRLVFGRRFAKAIMALLLGAAVCGGADAAELSYGFRDSEEGALVATVVLTPGRGESVGALQFDVTFDAGALRFQRVTTGSAAAAAEKSASFNEIAPGKVRVILAGLNRNEISAGPIAQVEFENTGVVAPAMDVARAILSDPFGSAVPVRVVEGSNGAIVIREPAPKSDITVAAWGIAGGVLLGLAAFGWRILSPEKRRNA